MKLKDLPNKSVKLSTILILMPDNIFEQVKEFGLNTKEVYFRMTYNGSLGYFVSTKETGNQIFPIPNRNPKEVLEWKVIDHNCLFHAKVKNSENGLFQKYCDICGKNLNDL